jgi:hypothetical protein
MKNIYIDIDNTICHTNGMNYADSTPDTSMIDIVNELYNAGNTITMWTARGTVSGIDHYDLTASQLSKWGVKYHKLILKKPNYDILIDDKALNSLKTLQNILMMTK